MAQLVERSPLIIEVRGSNPVIGENLYSTFTVDCFEKTKIMKKNTGIAHFLKNDGNYLTIYTILKAAICHDSLLLL